ncbi:alpha/beta fold hydrolase [Sphingomonas ginkgonis]|nr:alpha/beta fold hydrolase [Sphingomonas ginkgonis]
MLHVPTGGSPDVTVVICPPVGRDFIWTYRAMFEWADALARAGYRVLRFDHRGHGDSLDVHPGEDQWQHWLDGVAAAGRFARRSFGASKLVLAGLRIGATLAAEAATTLDPDGLILLDPIATGAGWLRELERALAMSDQSNDVAGTLEVNGVWLSAAAIASVRMVDLGKRAGPWPPTLVVSPSIPKPLRDSLGEKAEIIPFAGYNQLFKDSHLSAPPLETFEATRGWLKRQFPVTATVAAGQRLPSSLAGDGWMEERIDVGGGLRGVLTQPPGKDRARQAVIIVNTSANPRTGDGNFPVKAARALARRGVATLRVDFLGVGESDAHGEGTVHVYNTVRTAEVNQAASALAKLGFGDISAVGVCTGGYHAIQAACEGDGAIKRVLAFNSWITWKPGTPLDRSAHAESMRSIYLRTPVKIRRALTIRHRLISEAKVAFARMRAQFWPEPEVRGVLRQLQRAAGQGTDFRLVAGEGDRSWQSLSKFGPGGRRVRNISGVIVRPVHGLDHPVVSLTSQRIALREIGAFLGLPDSDSLELDPPARPATGKQALPGLEPGWQRKRSAQRKVAGS